LFNAFISYGKTIYDNLAFMDPCMLIQFLQNDQQDATV